MAADYPKLKYKLNVKKFGLRIMLPNEPTLTETSGAIEGLGTPAVILHNVAVYSEDLKSVSYSVSVFFQEGSDEGSAQAEAIIGRENLEHLFPNGDFQRANLGDELSRIETDEYELRKYTKDQSTKFIFSYASGLFVYVLSVKERDTDDPTNFINFIRSFKPSIPRF